MRISMKMIVAALVVVMVFSFLGCNSEDDGIVDGKETENDTGLAANESLGLGTTTENATEPIDQLVLKDGGNGTADAENGTSGGSSTGSGNETGNESTVKGDLELHFLDVGNGDSIFVRTPNGGTMLIDGGNDDKGSFVLNYLRSQGITSDLNVMVATHPDSENIGGLDSIPYNLASVSETYDNGYGSKSQAYLGFVQFSQAKGMFITVTKDTAIEIDKDITVQLIAPYIDGYMNNSNDNSLVVKITYGSVSFLIMGDCTLECEKKIMGHDLKADVLRIAHMGADDATSQELLDNVKPRAAILSVGSHNEDDYPSSAVLGRIANSSIELLRTNFNGTIVAKTDGDGLTLRAEK